MSPRVHLDIVSAGGPNRNGCGTAPAEPLWHPPGAAGGQVAAADGTGFADRLCGQVGPATAGVFSCRFGTTVMINLRRWLQGTDLGGCRPNPYPFDEDGRFVSGPWQPS
ncbi:hypothetical protein O7621_11110 [Solwaraspora sp. WMMD937]|uniref:hypothetical protein n=1 Tax=Solwaraspora sp. WMMD937 TaxID=3016090 RepID=UPI00249B8019|nr:hypothetical protein [Solwaraspora sp. WMMD937]WFE23764.1 hypothetical protein O7621_11110 [Solwaraspora sp. WMMD937]